MSCVTLFSRLLELSTLAQVIIANCEAVKCPSCVQTINCFGLAALQIDVSIPPPHL